MQGRSPPHRKIREAAQKQMSKIWHSGILTLSSVTHEYARKLVSKLPGNLKVDSLFAFDSWVLVLMHVCSLATTVGVGIVLVCVLLLRMCSRQGQILTLKVSPASAHSTQLDIH